MMNMHSDDKGGLLSLEDEGLVAGEGDGGGGGVEIET